MGAGFTGELKQRLQRRRHRGVIVPALAGDTDEAEQRVDDDQHWPAPLHLAPQSGQGVVWRRCAQHVDRIVRGCAESSEILADLLALLLEREIAHRPLSRTETEPGLTSNATQREPERQS